MVIARLSSGFAVIGDTQFLPGYYLLLASPRANHRSDLSFDRRQRFLVEMSLLGEAIETACRGRELRRITYEILGNTDAYLHAHVFPRYSWEPAERHGCPVFLYPPGRWTDERYHFSEDRHGVLKHDIATVLQNLMRRAGSPEWSLSERDGHADRTIGRCHSSLQKLPAARTQPSWCQQSVAHEPSCERVCVPGQRHQRDNDGAM